MAIGDLIEYDKHMGLSERLYPFTAIDVGNGQMAIYTSEGTGIHGRSVTRYVSVPDDARIIAPATDPKAQRLAGDLWFKPEAVLEDMRSAQQPSPVGQGRKPAGAPGSSGGQFTGRWNTPPNRGLSD